MDIIKKLLALFLLVTASSCTSSYYKQPTNTPVATVSFSNSTGKHAVIYISINDNSYKIDNNLLENKHPQDSAEHKTNIPTGNKVTFKYVYNWILKKNDEIFISYARFGVPARFDTKQLKTANTCTNTISFIPEENKHYEVYSGLATDKCIIKAYEVTEKENLTNELISITEP